MRATVKVLFIVALVSLLAVAIIGCEENENQSVPKGDIRTSSPASQDIKKISESLDANSDFTAQSQVDQRQVTTITLYFSDDQAEYLIPETRSIGKVKSVARAALEELIKGPNEPNLHTTVPPETRVLGIDIGNDVAYANFSSDLVDKHWGGSSGELMTITSIVNTLTEFDSIKKVQILVEGKVVETIAGHLDVSMPLARDETVIKK